MSKGGSGGSATSKVELPSWLEDAAKENLSRARYVSNLGYMPYYGNDVAAFSPMQNQAMMGTGAAAQAFGLAGQNFNPLAGMPQATTDANGFTGYSSGNLFDAAMEELQRRRPAQYDAATGMFIDPKTGSQQVAFTPVGSFAQQGASQGIQNSVDYGSGSSGVPNLSGESAVNFTQGLQDLADAPKWLYALPFVGAAKGAATAYVNSQANKMNANGGSSTPYLNTNRGFESGNVYAPPTTKSTSSTPNVSDTYNTSWGDSRTGTKSYTVGSDGKLQTTYSSGFSPETAAGLSIASKQNDTKSYQDDWAEPDGTITGDSNSSSGGGCFITTATLNATGQDDDGVILNTFRKFRDEFMGGKQGEAQEYYEIAPKIVESIGDNKEEYERIWDKYLSDAYEMLQDNRFGDAYHLYKIMVGDLKQKWLGRTV